MKGGLPPALHGAPDAPFQGVRVLTTCPKRVYYSSGGNTPPNNQERLLRCTKPVVANKHKEWRLPTNKSKSSPGGYSPKSNDTSPMKMYGGSLSSGNENGGLKKPDNIQGVAMSEIATPLDLSHSQVRACVCHELMNTISSATVALNRLSNVAYFAPLK